jgi:peptidoglycan-N-acetylglucosamine deacetylase
VVQNLTAKRYWAVGLFASVFLLPSLAQEARTIFLAPNELVRYHSVDAATIRLHRLSHFHAKLNTDPAELHASCKFESDISTPPPHKRIALTFDDGPEPGQTGFILDTLKRHNIRAAFFMIGEQAKRHPDLVARVISEGHHLIGNHSWDHPNFHTIDAAEQALEVEKSEQVLLKNMSKRLFRYPYGNASCETNQLLHNGGYKIVGWHIDSCDWAFDKSGMVDAKEAATCGVLPQFHKDYVGHVLSAIRAHNGGIVLMHEIHPNTLQKLDAIITAALEDGFVFGSIDEPEFEHSMR